MTGRGDALLAPKMAEVWGGREQWDLDSPWETRWSILLGSGCSEGKEIQQVWRNLQGEYETSKNWLGLEEEG